MVAMSHGLMGEGYWHLQHGRTAEALERFERAWSLPRKNLVLSFHTLPAFAALVTARRRHAEAMKKTNEAETPRLFKRAFRLAKWGVQVTRFFPPDYPLALRELSLLYEAKGKTRKALKLADKSCAVAQRQQAKCEHAQSLLVRGKLARQLGLPEAEEQIQQAEAELELIENSAQESLPNASATSRDGVTR